MIYQRTRGRIGGRVMSGLNGQHSGRAGMLSGVAAAIAGMTLNWASSPGNLIPPGFSLTRTGGGATYYDSTGTLQTAAADTARGTYIYNGSAWVFDGTMIEAAATNTCLQSEDLTTTWTVGAGVSVTANAYTAPTGAATMDRINASAGNTQHYLQIPAGVVISAGTAAFSFYFKYDNLQYVGLGMNDGTTSVISMFDVLNGTAGTPAYFAGSGTASTRITSIGGGVFRAELTSTMTGSAASTLYVIMGNSITAGIPTWNATGNEKVGAWGGQVETGNGATSYIATTTTAQGRNADVVTAPTSGLLVNGQGFAAIGGRIIAQNGSGPWAMLACAAGEGWPLYFANSTLPSRLALYDGTSIINFGASTQIPAAGTAFKAATTWSGIVASGALNGTVGSPSSAFDSSLGLGTTIRIGDVPAGGFRISMVLQSMRLGVQAVNNSRLANPFA